MNYRDSGLRSTEIPQIHFVKTSTSYSHILISRVCGICPWPSRRHADDISEHIPRIFYVFVT